MDGGGTGVVVRDTKSVGLAVVGAGRIGTLRAEIAAQHAATNVIAVADQDPSAAEGLAVRIGAPVWSTSHEETIAHDDVTAVIVATPEHLHVDAVLAALDAGRSVLVEKPLALTLKDADRLVAAATTSVGTLRVGYTRRYRRRYAVAKEQIVSGRLGTLTGGAARVYNTRAQAFAMLERNPEATPVVDALTYYVDLMQWFLGDRSLREVTAIGQRGVLAAAGHAVDDVTWAILRYDDGAAVSLGVSYALPDGFPVRGHAARVELIGTDGVLLIDDDHTDQLLHTEHAVPHVYLSDDTAQTTFLSSGTPGDWALGHFVGPLAAETRAWLDHLSSGTRCHLATPGEARSALATTLAIEQAASSGETIRLP